MENLNHLNLKKHLFPNEQNLIFLQLEKLGSIYEKYFICHLSVNEKDANILKTYLFHTVLFTLKSKQA